MENEIIKNEIIKSRNIIIGIVLFIGGSILITSAVMFRNYFELMNSHEHQHMWKMAQSYSSDIEHMGSVLALIGFVVVLVGFKKKID